MKLTITKVIGNKKYPFEVEGKSLFDVVMESQKLSFYDVPKCGVCQSDLLSLRAYITKEKKFAYVKIECSACRASLTFGRTQENPDVFYLRKNKETKALDWKKYEGPDDPVEFED